MISVAFSFLLCVYVFLHIHIWYICLKVVGNDIYKDVTIVPSNIPTVLVDSIENKNAELADVDSLKGNLKPEEESYLERCRIVSNESVKVLDFQYS